MFKKHKNKIIISSLVILGLLLILFDSINLSKEDTERDYNAIYTEELETKLENFLKNVNGIKDVKVIITLDASAETVFAQNGNGSNIVITNDGKPISVTEKYPVVRGVAIACTNGNDDVIKKNVTELVSAYLGISSNRIKIVSIQ